MSTPTLQTRRTPWYNSSVVESGVAVWYRKICPRLGLWQTILTCFLTKATWLDRVLMITNALMKTLGTHIIVFLFSLFDLDIYLDWNIILLSQYLIYFILIKHYSVISISRTITTEMIAQSTDARATELNCSRVCGRCCVELRRFPALGTWEVTFYDVQVVVLVLVHYVALIGNHGIVRIIHCRWRCGSLVTQSHLFYITAIVYDVSIPKSFGKKLTARIYADN